jgi:hypothetical protein
MYRHYAAYVEQAATFPPLVGGHTGANTRRGDDPFLRRDSILKGQGANDDANLED